MTAPPPPQILATLMVNEGTHQGLLFDPATMRTTMSPSNPAAVKALSLFRALAHTADSNFSNDGSIISPFPTGGCLM